MIAAGPAVHGFSAALRLIGPAALLARGGLLAMGAALLTPPLGIVVALAAVGVAAYVFRDDIIGAFGAAKDFVVGVAGEISERLTGAFNAVLDFGRDNWPEIVTLISGPFAPLVALATDAFGVR